MSTVRLIGNTDKAYPCTNCGSSSISIIREDKDPRIKCNNCSFTYDASESVAAQEADAIPDEPPVLQDPNPPSLEETFDGEEGPITVTVPNEPHTAIKQHIPRKPDYVFMSKTRQRIEFVSAKNLKKTALKWEADDINYECYLLTVQKIEAKIELE